jgi:hypothetical protein
LHKLQTTFFFLLLQVSRGQTFLLASLVISLLVLAPELFNCFICSSPLRANVSVPWLHKKRDHIKLANLLDCFAAFFIDRNGLKVQETLWLGNGIDEEETCVISMVNVCGIPTGFCYKFDGVTSE